MNNILEDMYYGRILPFWEHSIESPEYREKVKESIAADRELRAAFPNAERLIDKSDNARNEVQEIVSYQQFVYGFRVGAQLMLEMLQKVD